MLRVVSTARKANDDDESDDGYDEIIIIARRIREGRMRGRRRRRMRVDNGTTVSRKPSFRALWRVETPWSAEDMFNVKE